MAVFRGLTPHGYTCRRCAAVHISAYGSVKRPLAPYSEVAGKMVKVAINRRWAGFWLWALVGLVAAAPAIWAADKHDAWRRKVEADRQKAQAQRKYVEQSRGAKPTVYGPTRPVHEPANKGRAEPDSAKALPLFDASSAPAPAECLKTYVAAAKSATSLTHLLPYLPEARQRALMAEQSHYDPRQAAASRENQRMRNPELTAEQVGHLTDSPYTTALEREKGIAKHILDVLSVKTEGNTAKLVVSTSYSATVNGKLYPYSTADVEMVGEGRLWKMTRFDRSMLYYKEPPTRP